MLNALVNTENAILEYRNHAIPPPDLPQKGLRWLPVHDTDPPFTDTQKRTGPVVTVLSDQVTRVWTVTDKTGGEIAAEKDAEAQSQIDGQKMLKAIALWAAQKFGVTPATARSEIIAVYKALP